MPRKKRSPDLSSIVTVQEMIHLPDDIAKELDSFLSTHVQKVMNKRDEILPRVQKWRRTISGVRTGGRVRRSASNLSVPLLMWARAAVRARLTESAVESRRIFHIDPVPGRESEDSPSNQSIANALARFLTAEFLNPRGLDGKRAVEKMIAEMVDFGSAALKVVPIPDLVRKVGPSTESAAPRIHVEPGGVKWEFISLLNLLYFNGYGTDTQIMPFIGHEFPAPWSQIKTYAAMGYYDKEVVEDIKRAYADMEGEKPAMLQEHNIAELYLDWDIDDDGIMESIVVDWHVKGQKRLRTHWTPFPQGRRPILVAQFDLPSNVMDLVGQGVSEKLEGAQDEADAIHNIAIEAGKRGAAHVIALKANTRAEEEFGGDDELLPGDIIITETPKEDIQAIPLGDAQAAQWTMALEDHTRDYVTRILGLDESKLGNVESGKRVTAQVGMATMREGRMIIQAALSSVTNTLDEAAYLTLDLWRQSFPIRNLQLAVSAKDVKDILTMLLALPDSQSMRDAFIIRVSAQDAAIVQETRRQELLMINQALFPFYDRMQQLIIGLTNPQLPPAAKKPLLLLVERMERGMEALLSMTESIPNPDELLVRVGELKRLLDGETGEFEPGTTGNAPTDQTSSDMVGDLGAGVS